MKKFGIFVMAMAMVTIMISCKPGNDSEPVEYVSSVSELIDKEVIIVHGDNHEQHQLIYGDVTYDVVAYHVLDKDDNDRVVLEDAITVADNTINGTKTTCVFVELIDDLFISQL